jgi:hypothetical protein
MKGERLDALVVTAFGALAALIGDPLLFASYP